MLGDAKSWCLTHILVSYSKNIFHDQKANQFKLLLCIKYLINEIYASKFDLQLDFITRYDQTIYDEVHKI